MQKGLLKEGKRGEGVGPKLPEYLDVQTGTSWECSLIITASDQKTR